MSLLDWDDKVYIAVYNSFKVGTEKEKYELRLSGYNAELSTLADGFTLGNNINQAFTTSDEDNDNRKASNCATDFSGGNFLNSS